MKFTGKGILIMVLLSGVLFFSRVVHAQYNRNNLFDAGWCFHRGGAQGAENPSFDDSGWKKLDLPHDWSIEDLPGTGSPFDRDAVSQVSGGFTTGGTGWYRKRFTVPSNLKNKKFMLFFEGVYMNSEVWLNGKSLGRHPYGYTSFWFDISESISLDGENVLSVKVMNEGENSRWYSGSGIYRHVWLQVLPQLHVDTWGTRVTTRLTGDNEARVNVNTNIVNQSDQEKRFRVVTTIISEYGGSEGRAESEYVIEAGKSSGINQNIQIIKPRLWSVETPFLYTAVTEIYENEVPGDRTETTFGIRTLSFSSADGFLLNGKSVKLKGGCVHHDNGPLGAKAYDRAEERRVEILKESGFNAIRCSHNPPSPAFLDACDRLGMLVIDEAFDMWSRQKNPYDYHLFFNDWWRSDVESMVLRDRNHPSVIMWSIGNEIPDRHKPEVVEQAKMLADFIRKTDPGRAVTSAVNDLKPDKDPYFAVLDIAGYNYASGGDHNKESLYRKDHERVPGRIMAGTESYPLEAFGSWMDVIDNPFVIGDFVWTAFDYIGEASIGWRGYWQKQDFFPWNLAYCGDIDICGWKRPQSYYRDALWKENQLSVWVTPPVPSFELNPDRQSWSKWHWLDAVDDWNWEGYDGRSLEVSVYSSCAQVELFLNGKSLGRKLTGRPEKFMAIWQVPYQPGTLKAIGYQGKSQVNIQVPHQPETLKALGYQVNDQVIVKELKSAGKPVRIRLTPDRTVIRAGGQDLSYITVELTDNPGLRNPKAENQVTFEIEGQGSIIGTGNANPVSLESFTGNERKAWHGRCMVIVRSATERGNIVLRAKSPGFDTAEIQIKSE